MKYYYALFKETKDAIEVEFPDLQGCVTFGENWDEAIVNATDALAAYLAHAQEQFIKPPSSYNNLVTSKGKLIPIPIDEVTLSSYQELKRFNVILPAQVLGRIDDFRKKIGLKRSTFLQKAAEEYLEKHEYHI
jgi:predicted RNase H-like HicB family nuclease